jgi:broad specificity phosphatase PhoE
VLARFAHRNNLLILKDVKQLYLIRHCETKELAGQEAAHPRNDSSLSSGGLRQAARLADYLRQSPIDLILTSLFQRSQQTAAIINQRRSAPVFSGMALNEYFLRDEYEGAETADMGLVRSMNYINQFRPYFDYIAVVGHNSILSTMRMSLLNMPFDEGKEAFSHAGTCRVLRYDWEEGDQNWKEADSFIP